MKMLLACLLCAGCSGSTVAHFDTQLITVDDEGGGLNLTLYPNAGSPPCPSLSSQAMATADGVQFTLLDPGTASEDDGSTSCGEASFQMSPEVYATVQPDENGIIEVTDGSTTIQVGVRNLGILRTMTLSTSASELHVGDVVQAAFAPAAQKRLSPSVDYDFLVNGTYNFDQVEQDGVTSTDSGLTWSLTDKLKSGTWELDVEADEDATLGCVGAQMCQVTLSGYTSLDFTLD